MDVTRSLLPPGTTPSWRRRTLPAGLLGPSSGGGGAAAAPTAATTARVMTPVEVRGSPDGPELVLPSGVRIRRTHIGALRVTDAQLVQAIRGVQLLPAQHQLVVARAGVAIELVPVPHLEQVMGTSQPVLGATAVDQKGTGPWIPRGIRVAVASPLSERGGANAIGEVVQHEVGHAVAVLGWQDRTEQTAERYARTY